MSVLQSLKSFFWPTQSYVRPRLNVNPYSNQWRLINLAVAMLFSIVASAQFDDPDWWLWVPAYISPCIISLGIAFNPRIVERYLWRYLCAFIIVFGITYLIYLFWIVREVSSAYVQDPTDVREGRELAGLSLVILWALVCRLTASSVGGIVNVFRLLLLFVTFSCCVGIFMWSLCFYQPGLAMLPYCRYQFHEGYKNL